MNDLISDVFPDSTVARCQDVYLVNVQGAALAYRLLTPVT